MPSNVFQELSVTDALHFALTSVKPGKYLLFATEEGDLELWNDPEAIGLLKDGGTECDIAEGANLQVHLKLIPKTGTDAVRQQLGY